MGRSRHRIIIEGMDGSGKTTLVKNLLASNDKFELVKNDMEDKKDFNVWWPKVLDRPDDGTVPLHDRFFYSELVYGPTLRGHITAEAGLVQNVLYFLRSTAMLIYARPTVDSIRKGIMAHRQKEGVHDKFDQLLELYDQLMAAEKSWFADRFIHYVWTREGENDRVIAEVERYINDNSH